MKALGLPVSVRKNYEFFILGSYVQTCDPKGGASFDPRGIICPNLVEVHKEMLHIKYQSSTIPVSEKKSFKVCLLFPCVPTCDPRVGAIVTLGASYEQSW